jgi:hypothetical protein
VDGSSEERYGKEREEMDTGATSQGMGRQRQIRDFFVTVDPKNWKRLKKEEEGSLTLIFQCSKT